MKILALDIATNTGFCTETASGVWKLTPKKDESKGMRLIRFKAKLKEVCALEGINLIAFEQVAMYGKFPNLVAPEMIGVLKLFCEENGIDYKSYAPTVVKKFGTGKGNAGKDMMVAAAQRYKEGITSDDEADAVILYHLAKDDLQL
jgi:Holliday junction resolvasome RuvABC endonuclease subunit